MLSYFDQHSIKGLLIDANLLVLWLVGGVSVGSLKNTKITSAFEVKDVELLYDFAHRSRGPLLTTPHVLAETSNLVRQALYGKDQARAMEQLGNLVLERLEEQNIPARGLVSDPIFHSLGLADAGIASLKSRGCVVLTADGTLYQRLSGIGVPALNFNHFRPHLKP